MNAVSPAPSQALSPGARRPSIAVVATGGTIAGAGTGGDGAPSAAYQSAVVSADALLRGVGRQAVSSGMSFAWMPPQARILSQTAYEAAIERLKRSGSVSGNLACSAATA